MKAVIVEDEKLTANRLESLIGELMPELVVTKKLHSVEEALHYFQSEPHPDVVFMDIELGDGTAFDILDKIQSKAQIVFTTAYNDYAVKAFKYNSLDYILKPIEKAELAEALERVKPEEHLDWSSVLGKVQDLIQPQFKQRFLVKTGDKIAPVNVDDVAYFYSEEGYTFLRMAKNRHIIDYALDDLEDILDPTQFFRVNRKFLIRVNSVTQFSSYFNGRLVLQLSPTTEEQIVVPRDRVKAFKEWIDG